MATKLDLTNQKYGSLTVLSEEPAKNRGTYWRCRCDCGNTVVKKTKMLRHERHPNCGCLTKQLQSINNSQATHRLSKSPTYQSWCMMKSRCNNPNYTHFKYYGARGITYCERWESYENFMEDMGERPKGYTLDRIDSEGNYTPSNCKWSTRENQADNRRNNVYLTYDNRTMYIKDWALVLGVKRSQIYLALYNGATLSGYIAKRGLVPDYSKL